jgi:hypothetical protein
VWGSGGCYGVRHVVERSGGGGGPAPTCGRCPSQQRHRSMPREVGEEGGGGGLAGNRVRGPASVGRSRMNSDIFQLFNFFQTGLNGFD